MGAFPSLLFPSSCDAARMKQILRCPEGPRTQTPKVYRVSAEGVRATRVQELLQMSTGIFRHEWENPSLLAKWKYSVLQGSVHIKDPGNPSWWTKSPWLSTAPGNQVLKDTEV